MSLAGRIRIYLIAVAVLPPLIVMAVIYFHSARQAEVTGGAAEGHGLPREGDRPSAGL